MATMTTAAGMNMMGATRVARGRGQSGTQSVAERNLACFEVQRKNRRGPTPEVFFTKHIDNTRIVKADDPVRRREMRTFTLVMSALFLLVMVYVWQHFASIEVGYHVETQKAQVEQLREENRQLRLTQAELSDPGRIDKIAKQLGLDQPQPGQIVRPDGGDPNGPVMAQARMPVVATY
jgi:cell division protein FtsL